MFTVGSFSIFLIEFSLLPITVNASSEISEDLGPINEFLNDWIGLLVAIFGGIISIISFFYSRKRDKFNGLSEAFKILNDNVHREARRVVNRNEVTPASRKILGFDDDKPDDEEVRRVCGDIVTTDMDQIGTMAQNKLFNEKIFLQRYSSSILMAWLQLEVKIHEQRDSRLTEDYGRNFEYLVNATKKFWLKEYNEDPDEIMGNIAES